jgi:dTDP-4-dehydrorhamnose reductase
MGVVLEDVFACDYSVIGLNTTDFDACDFAQVQNLIEEVAPDIVIKMLLEKIAKIYQQLNLIISKPKN